MDRYYHLHTILIFNDELILNRRKQFSRNKIVIHYIGTWVQLILTLNKSYILSVDINKKFVAFRLFCGI